MINDADAGDGGGLSLPTLGRKPNRPEKTLIVAVFAYEGRLGGEFVPGPRRGFQRYLRRTDGSRVSKLLEGLVIDEFLESTWSGNRGMAYEYRLHLSIRGDEAAAWVELGRQISDPESGLVGEFLTRPAMKHGHVMMTGFTVVGLLLRCGPMEVRSLVKILSPIMSRNTVVTRVQRLAKIGVVNRRDTTVSLRPDWSTILDWYEDEFGLKDFADKQDEVIAEERELWQAKIGGGAEMIALRKTLRSGTCVACDEPADEVEHFPPKRWGGFDHPMLMTSLCLDCNNRRSHIVKASPPPPRLVLLRQYRKYPSTVTPSEWAEQGIEEAHRLFMESEETGDADAFEASKLRSARGLARLEFAELGHLPSASTLDKRSEAVLERIAQVLAAPPSSVR